MSNSKKKEHEQPSKSFWFVEYGSADPGDLSPVDWMLLIGDAIMGCNKILILAAKRKYNEAKPLQGQLNYPLKGSSMEKRITSEEIINALSPSKWFMQNNWLLIPIKILSSGEERGQFFERKLFLAADICCLVILDVKYRKEPQPNQKGRHDPPMINEVVVECEMLVDNNHYGGSEEKFFEVIAPYFEDKELKLGMSIFDNTLNRAVTELREMRQAAAEIEKTMVKMLEIRKRLGITNIL